MQLPTELCLKIARMSDDITAYNLLLAYGFNRDEILSEIGRYRRVFVYNGDASIPDDCEFCYIDESISNIIPNVFSRHSKLETVIMSDNINTIHPATFLKCTSLKNVKLSNNLHTIGLLGFASCVSLKEIKIPKSVEHVDTYAFNRCLNLEVIDIEGSDPEWGGCVFTECYKVPVRFFLIK